MTLHYSIPLRLITLLLTVYIAPVSSASVVTLHQTGSSYELVRNGTPYLVKGAGGDFRIGDIAVYGGNSVRTWGTNTWILDSAAAHGMTVTMGIWDPATALNAVAQYKNHNALLMWGLGNEMETRTSDAIGLWKMCDSIAVSIKQSDPDHPVMTVVAEISTTKIQQIKDNYPHLDILGINSYGGCSTLATRLANYGWTKPYMVTEFGPLGHWEVGKTTWGVPVEQTSTQKAETYALAYQNSIAGKGNCLGSYAFLWGFKQEKTHTWYGMFLQENSGGGRTAAVDAMTFAWTGVWPLNRCPTITGGIIIDTVFNKGNGNKRFIAGTLIRCRVLAADPENILMTFLWDLRKDVSLNPTSGGGSEPENPSIAGAVIGPVCDSAVISLPLTQGLYRVHVYVHDNIGNAATANLPIAVDPAAGVVPRALSLQSAKSRCLVLKKSQFDAQGRLLLKKRRVNIQPGM